MKILLAEDDEPVREELRELLTDEGYRVVTAVDGIDAFEKFRQDQEIELLLLDIRMPRCTGLQMLDAARKTDAANPRIYEAIFITGNNDSESVVNALKLNAYSFLFKPIVVQTLIEEIEKAKDNINMRRYREFQRETLDAQVSNEAAPVAKITGLQKKGIGSAIELLAISAEHGEPDIDQHVNRVGEMSACLGTKLGLDTEACQNLRLAAMLHDIGKIKHPSDVYLLERTLVKNELDAIKPHTTSGAELVLRSQDAIFKLAQTICAQHHENYDGSGYPHGLKGNDIALEANIVHIVDVYDNLRSKRPYKESMPHHVALETIVEGDARSHPDHFHPAVLTTFLAQHRDIEAIYERYRPK